MQQTAELTTRAAASPRGSILNRIVTALLNADQSYREGRAIKRLTDDQLDDVGLSRSEIEG